MIRAPSITLACALAIAACTGHDEAPSQGDGHEAHDHHAESAPQNARDDHDGREARREQDAGEETDGEREVLYWYDPMHPEARFDEPGPSPFMDMDLVPRYADEVTPGEVRVAREMQQRTNIRTARAEKSRLTRRIETVGHVVYDEANRHHLHPRVEGWIEHLTIADVGDIVREGQLLYTLYAPELVNAQEELLQAKRRGDSAALRGARAKLRALDVQSEAIAALEQSGEVKRALPWRARRDGVVTHLGVRHGMYVTPSTEIVELADLSRLWVIAEVFDRHAAWLATGQHAEIRSSYLPGKQIEARISHIEPMLAEGTRTLRARLPIDNPEGRLKPGMWADVRIDAGATEAAVHIPREALIRTGRSARVVVHMDDERFSVREVIAGTASGDRIEILEGVDEGDRIVVSGHFLIDSEAALGAGYQRLEGSGDTPANDRQAQPETVSGTGEVIEIEPEAERIELHHAPIGALEWPEMTMGFRIDTALLPDALEPGQAVRFVMHTEADDAGDYRIVELEIADDGDGS